MNILEIVNMRLCENIILKTLFIFELKNRLLDARHIEYFISFAKLTKRKYRKNNTVFNQDLYP